MDKILNPLGDWNLQLFRELKGRSNRTNVAIAQWGVILGCLWGLQQQIQRLGQSDLKTFQPTPTE